MIKRTLCFTSPAKLSVELSQLKISTFSEDGSPTDVRLRPLEDIGIVIIDNPRVSLTQSVMEGLMTHGAALIVCDKKHLPSGLMLNLEGHSLQSMRFRTQLAVSLPLRKQLWQQTVAAKIRNQAAALHIVKKEKADNMLSWAKIVKSGDSENIEARAANYYWKRMFENYPDVRRERFGEDPNALLNYGYAIVRASVARALVASGLHPSLGLFHSNKYNAYCLADDVMEPYRPYVDVLVMQMIKDGIIPQLEDKSTRQHLLSLPAIDVIVGEEYHPMMNAIRLTAASLYKCFAGETRKISYPVMQY